MQTLINIVLTTVIICVFSVQVYAVGGYDGQSRLSSVECYDSFSNRWTEVAPMKEAVSSPAVSSCAGKLFVIGGGPDDNTCSDKVGRPIGYTIHMDNWLRCTFTFRRYTTR